MEFVPFPKWKYHPSEPPCVVADAEAETALGDGWYDSPVAAAAARDAEPDGSESGEVDEAALASEPAKKRRR
jgi:hypothetical protein